MNNIFTCVTYSFFVMLIISVATKNEDYDQAIRLTKLQEVKESINTHWH